MTLQEAKDQIAQEAGYQSWIHLDEFSPPYKYEQALQKLVQLYATEAIKADREQIEKKFHDFYFLVEEIRGGEFCDVPKFIEGSIQKLPINLN